LTPPDCKKKPPRFAWHALAAVLSSVVLASCGGGSKGEGPPPEIRTVSNRADLISDGDALVEITAPPGIVDQGLTVTLNGTDVSSAFVQQAKGTLLGRVTGLQVGNNVLVATAKPGHGKSAQLVITNAPRSGPVLSGAQITPYYCATPTPQPQSGNTPATNASGLSGQPDADCNIATETKLYYRTTATVGTGAGQCSAALPDPVWNSNGNTGVIPAAPTPPANPCWKPYTAGTTPADMATVTTDNGQTVPFIVRLERGTMNRGIYDLAVLFDASKTWTPVAPQAQWNGKVFYSFGASTGQPRRQARSTATAWSALELQLQRGWIVVSNSMTDSLRNSNRVVMAETVMMMKEHIGDTYGPIKFTLGTGCSGGSINSNMNLSIMPGNLDGVVTNCTYPDSETTSLEVGDCTLLVEAYQKSPLTTLWTGMTQADINAKKAAINGHPDQTGCQAWFNLFGSNGKAGLYKARTVSDQVTGAITEAATPVNNCELPNSAVYDPANPTTTAGLPRCNAWSWGASIWGTVSGSPAAKDTRDNVGVQYGLGALLAGKITAEEFVTLNEVIGGTDRDTTPTAARTAADSDALATAYRSGIVASGKNLAKAAIIDERGWDDSLITTPPGSVLFVTLFGIHHQWYSWAIRDRITRDAGDAKNQAMWRFARGAMPASPAMTLEAFNNMDQWLTTLATDTSNRPLEQKVRAARPDSSKDFCYLTSDTTQSTKIYDQATCDADPFLKPAASPRQVAGGPRSEDVLKCQLKPLNVADYGGVIFSGTQWTRLQNVFSTGVCDWSKPGVQQQAAVSPLTFKNGPGGEPLGDAPTSTRR
jgi:hypothetical protein